MYIAQIIVVMIYKFCVITVDVGPVILDKSLQGITDMTSHPMLANTEEVRFGGNAITQVQAGYFVNQSKLVQIKLNKNRISSISDHAFAEVPSVTYIALYFNDLEVIHKNMFSGLYNLQGLRLQGNKIWIIEAQSFKDCSALTMLWLHNNLLQAISECIFHPWNHPTNLESFYIDKNLLSCNESLAWLKIADGHWITVKDPKSTICAEPDHLRGHSWNNISAHDLNPNATGRFHLIIDYRHSSS